MRTVSKISNCCLKEVAELQTFCTETRRNWKLIADVLNGRGVIVRGGTMVAQHSPPVLAENVRTYTPLFVNEKMSIKIMAEELKSVCW